MSWDDAKNFLENPHYRGLGSSQLAWMWTTFHLGHYVPLSWMTLGLDYVLWGMNPAGYHVTSVLLHTVNAVVLYFIARRILGRAIGGNESSSALTWAAAFAALAFALHPLRVESVVWITERRDTLSLLFYELSVLAYLRFCDASAQRSRWYALSLAAFVCALLSKGTSVTLPAVLLILDVYPLRRISGDTWRDTGRTIALELLPFVLASAAFSLLSIVALHPPAQLGLGAKLAVSAYSLQFYISKTLLPLGLSALYEMPRHVDPFEARFIVSYLACAALAVIAWAARRRWPGATAAIVAFVVISLPLLGIVQNGPQIAADRYTYHSGPALALLASGALFFVLPLGTSAQRGAAIVIVGLLGLLTWDQSSVWHDSERLWTRVLAIEPNSAIGHSAMANVRYKQGRMDEGLSESQKSVDAAPEYAEAHNDLGVGLASRGQLAEAAAQYREALSLKPGYDEALNNLGVVSARQGQIDAAVDAYRQALEANPDFADAQVNWGNALVRSGRQAEAIPHYQAALAIRPDHADAHHNWGVALAQLGRFAEAADQFRAALAIDPNHAEAKAYLALALKRLGVKEP